MTGSSTDMVQYKQAFLSEAQEHIDSLNEGLLSLEKDSSDEESINKAFRSFHTLKGNSAAMGYIKFSELSHSLENLLSKIRDKKIQVSQNIMDVLFDGCDLLEDGLKKIESDDSENLDMGNILKELHSINSGEGKGEEVHESPNESIELSDDEMKLMEDYKNSQIEKGEGGEVNAFRIIVIFDPSNPLKGIKGIITMNNVCNNCKLVKMVPSEDKVKQKKFDSEIEFVILTNKRKEGIEKEINKITGIKEVIILNLDEKYNKPEETVNHEKEMAKNNIAQQHTKEIVQKIQSVRVNMNKLDKFMNLVGELLISNIRLQDINNKGQYGSLKTVLSGVDRLILDLQDEVIDIRMVPIGNIFTRFPRMVRDLGEKENKKIELIIEGSEIEFDRTVLDQIGDPLVHLLRNSVDHAIELPDERMNSGKPEHGTIKLIAKREKNSAVIEIRDDGSGIDPKAVKEASIRKGIISEKDANKMSDTQLLNLIFKPGMSTNKVVTDVSGRGVGMDVVQSKVSELGGHVKLASELGKGTVVTISLPLTVAIISALLVKAKEEVYAIPLTNIDQTVDIHQEKIKTIHGNEVFILRNNEIPLLWLHELVGHSEFEKSNPATVLIINKDNQQIGIAVDYIMSQQQILIKNIQNLKNTKGCSSATILGDGSVALILDTATLF